MDFVGKMFLTICLFILFQLAILPFIHCILSIYVSVKKENKKDSDEAVDEVRVQIPEEPKDQTLNKQLDEQEKKQGFERTAASPDDVQIQTTEVVNNDTTQGKKDDDDPSDEFVEEFSCCRLISLHCFFWVYIWFIGLMLSIILIRLKIQGDFTLLLFFCSGICLIISVIWVMIESSRSREYRYLRDMLQHESCMSFLDRLRGVRPKLEMQVECYHFETRTGTSTVYNADGTTSYNTYTYQVRVTDLIEKDFFKYDYFTDTSNDPRTLELAPSKVTRVRVDSTVQFGDSFTAEDFLRQKEEFIASVNSKGNWEHTCYSEEFIIDGYKKRICNYWNQADKLPWMNTRCFFLSTIFCGTWIYRFAFNRATQRTSYKLKKFMFAHHEPQDNE